MNFKVSAWRYGLYTTATSPAGPAGTRVTRNSNFTVKKVNPDLYGSIGYWGAWFPAGTTVTDNEQVLQTRLLHEHRYALHGLERGGKLKKYTRNIITLADIKNIPLVWFESSSMYPGGMERIFIHKTGRESNRWVLEIDRPAARLKHSSA